MENRQPSDYVLALFDKMETCHREGQVLPFRIMDMTQNGFRVKVGGLFAFVPFRLMPWKYNDKSAWKAVFPCIKDKLFFCKIDRIEHDPPRLFLDPSVHLFRPPAFREGQACEALVLNCADYGVFLDLGYHCGWRCGSHVALFHVSALKKRGLELHTIKPGDLLRVTYFGINPEGYIQIETPFEMPPGQPRIDEALVGQVIAVQVLRDEASGKNNFVAEGGIEGRIPVTKHQYHAGPAMKRDIREALRQLPGGCTIRCEVTGISYKRGSGLLLRWVASDWMEVAGRSENETPAGKT